MTEVAMPTAVKVGPYSYKIVVDKDAMEHASYLARKTGLERRTAIF